MFVWVGINPIESRKRDKSNVRVRNYIKARVASNNQNKYSNSSNQIRSNIAATTTTYSNRSIHALDVAFIHQYFARTQAQCLNFAFVQIFTPSQSFDLRIQ